MNNIQKAKRNFRASKKWKEFRHKKNVEQGGKCYISHKKLYKAANLHHLDMTPEHYDDLSKPENYVYLNKKMHDTVHVLYPLYVIDRCVLDRLKEVLDKMILLNGDKRDLETD